VKNLFSNETFPAVHRTPVFRSSMHGGTAMIWLSRDDFEKRYPPRVPSADLLDERRSSVLRGDVTIDSDTALRAVIGGNVTVRSGVQLNFHGVIKGSLPWNREARLT